MNQPDEAQPFLEQVVKADPANGMAHRDLGIILADKDRKEDASAEFKAAIKINPKDVNAHYRLARLYRSMGKTAEAKVEFSKASSLNKAEDERLLKVMSAKPAGDHKEDSSSAPHR